MKATHSGYTAHHEINYLTRQRPKHQRRVNHEDSLANSLGDLPLLPSDIFFSKGKPERRMERWLK